MMKLIFTILSFIYLVGNGYLFWRSLQTLTQIPLWGKLIFSLLFWLAAFALFISFGIKNSDIPEFFPRILFHIGAVWLVFLLYMVLTLIILDLVNIFTHNFTGRFWYALGVTAVILIAGNINYRNPKIENLELTFSNDTPKNDSIRIVAISDIHLGYGTGPEKLKKYVSKINSLNPDVVLIAGDMIDNSVKPLWKAPFSQELAKISVPIYLAPGNHEYISSINECSKYLSQTNVVMLRDSATTIGKGLTLIGRDDFSNKSRIPLKELLLRHPTESGTIVLDHQPQELHIGDSLGVDLIICGHTHNGQVWPLNKIVNKIYPQSHGYRKWSHSHIWVSSGLSLWGPPFRIGTRSDIAVITIKY